MGGKFFITLPLFVIIFTSFTRADEPNFECFECESTETDRTCIDKPGDKKCTSEIGQCYWKTTETGVTRGCLGAELVADCMKNPISCQRCIESKCNGEPVTAKPSIKCFKCDNCSENSNDPNSSPEQCSKDIPYKITEKCFTQTTKADGKTEIKKGCLYDLSEEQQKECSEKSEDCKTCEGDSCNKNTDSDKTEPTKATTETPKPTDPPNSEEFKCIICRSDVTNQTECASKQIKGEYFKQFSQKCEVTPTKDADKACYTQRLENGVVIRDCFSTALLLKLDISADACDITKNPRTKCSYCDKSECNNGEPRNSGNQVGTYGAFSILAALLVTRFL